MDALIWRKASRSASNGGGCVEVGRSHTAPVVGIRDTKSRERGQLTVTRETWQRFMAAIKAGRFDLRLARPSAVGMATGPAHEGHSCI